MSVLSSDQGAAVAWLYKADPLIAIGANEALTNQWPASIDP